MTILTAMTMLVGAGMVFYAGERMKADPFNPGPILFLAFGVLFMIISLMVADLSSCGCGC